MIWKFALSVYAFGITAYSYNIITNLREHTSGFGPMCGVVCITINFIWLFGVMLYLIKYSTIKNIFAKEKKQFKDKDFNKKGE